MDQFPTNGKGYLYAGSMLKWYLCHAQVSDSKFIYKEKDGDDVKPIATFDFNLFHYKMVEDKSDKLRFSLIKKGETNKTDVEF